MYGLLLALLATTPLATPPGIVRGIYCDPGEALGGQLWADFGAGFEVDAREHHGGGSSLKCANAAATEAQGAVQTVKFASASPRPIVVSGWAKLQGVAGPKDYRCSVYLDLMLEGGESWPMKIATFDPSKAGWQYSEATYTPPKPLVSARVYVFLREREGVAWFDDLSVCQVLDDAGRRGPNLLRDAGFEQAAVGDPALRDAFFAKLTAIGCNAFHFYRSVARRRPGSGPATRPPTPAPRASSRRR